MKLIPRLALVAILTSGFIPLIWILLSAFEQEILLYEAERIAGDRPYCIAVSDNARPFRYKKAIARSELTYSALVTRLDWGGSSGPFAENYYALLILQNPSIVRNWSKRSLNFEDDVNPTQASIYRANLETICPPMIGFASTIH